DCIRAIANTADHRHRTELICRNSRIVRGGTPGSVEAPRVPVWRPGHSADRWTFSPTSRKAGINQTSAISDDPNVVVKLAAKRMFVLIDAIVQPHHIQRLL